MKKRKNRMTKQTDQETPVEAIVGLLEVLEGVEHETAIECLVGALCARAVLLGWSPDALKKFLGEQVDHLYNETLAKAIKDFGVKLPS